MAGAATAAPAGLAVNLGTGDDQAAITVHVGDTINVNLKPDGQWRFSIPESSDATVLRRVDVKPHGRRHHHKVTGSRSSFRATAAGEATLEAFGSLYCNKGHVCPALAVAPTPLIARLWRVDVTVE